MTTEPVHHQPRLRDPPAAPAHNRAAPCHLREDRRRASCPELARAGHRRRPTCKCRCSRCRLAIGGSFRRVSEAAGIPGLRFHDLRHSAATLLLAQGIPQRVVMEQLGHATLAMTQRYTHVLPQLMGEAAAAMDRALANG